MAFVQCKKILKLRLKREDGNSFLNEASTKDEVTCSNERGKIRFDPAFNFPAKNFVARRHRFGGRQIGRQNCNEKEVLIAHA